jgi:hypothetical protein
MDPYNPKSPKKDAINFFDMGTFALARFDRVAALKKYLDTGLQVGKGRGRSVCVCGRGGGMALDWHASDNMAALMEYLDTSCRWGKPGRGAPGRHALTVWRLSQSIWAPGCRLGMWAAHNC